MAEAIALAGLASSIITFIDASVKLARVYKQFYNTCGQLPGDLAICQRNADELAQRITEIQRSLHAHPQVLESSETDGGLQRVIVDCTAVCKRFRELMCSLIPSTPVPTSEGKSSSAAAKSTLRVLRHRGEIKELQSKLEELKNDLRCCMAERTMRLSEVACRQNGQLIESSQEFVQVHNANHSDLLSYLAEHQNQVQSVSTEVGWLKIDVQSINQKADHVLVLVQDLVAVNNSARGDSITIRIEVPSRLIKPVLEIFRMARNLPQQVRQSPAWLPFLGDTSPIFPRRKARRDDSLSTSSFFQMKKQFEMTTGDMQPAGFLTLAIKSSSSSTILVQIDMTGIKDDKNFFQAIQRSITSVRSQQFTFLRPSNISFGVLEVHATNTTTELVLTAGQGLASKSELPIESDLFLHYLADPTHIQDRNTYFVKKLRSSMGKTSLPENRHHTISISFGLDTLRFMQIQLLVLAGATVLTIILVIYGALSIQDLFAVVDFGAAALAIGFSTYVIKLGRKEDTKP